MRTFQNEGIDLMLKLGGMRILWQDCRDEGTDWTVKLQAETGWIRRGEKRARNQNDDKGLYDTPPSLYCFIFLQSVTALIFRASAASRRLP